MPIRKFSAALLAFVSFSAMVSAQQAKTLSLQESIEYAITHNLERQQNQLSKEQAENDLQQTKLQRFPSLNASAGQGFRFGRSIDPFTNQFVQETINSNNFSLNASLDVFKGFQQNRQIKSNTRNLQAQKAQVEATKNTIRTEVASRYLEVVLQRERLRNVRSQLEASKGQLEQAQTLVESGKANKSEALQLKSQVSSDKASLVEARNNLKMAYLDLQQYMNWEERKQLEVEETALPDSLSGLPDRPLEEVVQDNYERLPQVQQARYNLQSAQYSLKAAKSGRMPTLSFNARIRTGFSSRRQTPTGVERSLDTVGFVASSEKPVVRPGVNPILETPTFRDQLENNFSQQLNFRLSIPIFNNRSVETQIQNAQIQRQQANLRLEQQKQQVRKAINRAYTQAENAYEQHLAALEQLETQEALYEQAKARYEAGAMSFYAWQNTKQDYNQAQNNYLQAKYQYLFNKKLYEFYLGRSLRLN